MIIANTLSHAPETEEYNDKGSFIYVLALSFIAAVGGLLFGFDTGVISGAISFVTDHFNLNTHQEGFAVSSLMVACTIGALVVGTLADRYGRKKILIVAALLFFVSALMSALPRTFIELIIGRFVGGLAVGIASVVSPMYIAEISPANIRGRLVAVNQLAIVVGILSTFFSNWLLVDIGPNNWRWMFAVGTIPAGVFFIALLFIPESPAVAGQAGEGCPRPRDSHTCRRTFPCRSGTPRNHKHRGEGGGHHRRTPEEARSQEGTLGRYSPRPLRPHNRH